MKLGISDFLQNYFLLLKFVRKIRSGQTNSAVRRTGRQKLRNARLCPLVGPRPTSPGVHPNYSLSFTTNVDRSFPSHHSIHKIARLLLLIISQGAPIISTRSKYLFELVYIIMLLLSQLWAQANPASYSILFCIFRTSSFDPEEHQPTRLRLSIGRS